jgi:hypothetical protein
MTSPIDDDDDLWMEDNSSYCLGGSFDVCPGTLDDIASEPHTPPPTGPYKRRRVMKSIGTGVEVDCYTEETPCGHEDFIDSSETDASVCENAIEAKQYRDVLILFRFNDHDLPFKLRQVVMSDLRLLTLLEAGLPSWVIFLQSYPGFCHLYRPWMCPLARALYVLISIITVLIGFYDLYKNVPVLKATASSLCGPLFDWIETWEMVSRIKYLGTMLFLHNFEKAVTWFLMVTRTTRSFFSVFTQPLVEPLAEILGFLLPAWNMFIEVAESSYSFVWIVIESSCSVLGDLIEIFAWPIWFLWSIGRFSAVLVICYFVSNTLLFYKVVQIPLYVCCFLCCSNFHHISHILDCLGNTLCSNSLGPCTSWFCGFHLWVDIRNDWGSLAICKWNIPACFSF